MRTLTDSRGVQYQSGHSWPHHDKLEGLCPDDLHDKINWTVHHPTQFHETLKAIADDRLALAERKAAELLEWLEAGNKPWWLL